MTHISQREARRLRKQLRVLEEAENNRRKFWVMDYPGGTEIARLSGVSETAALVACARKLNHAVVAIALDGGQIKFLALPNGRR